MSTILWLLAIWSKLERWKSLTNGCFMSWPKIKEKLLFWSVTLLIVCNNNRPFLNQIVVCQEKWILCDNWQWPAQWLEWKEPTSTFQSQTFTKKDHGHWWSAASLIHYNSLNFSETITPEKYAQQIEEMNQKLQCLQLALINRMGPIFFHDNTQLCIAQPMFQLLNEWVYKLLPHLLCPPGLLPTHYCLFKHLNNFLQGKCFHNQQEAENAFQEFIHRFLCYRNK